MAQVIKLKRNKFDVVQSRVHAQLLDRVNRAIAGKVLTDEQLVEIILNELEEVLVPMPKVA